MDDLALLDRRFRPFAVAMFEAARAAGFNPRITSTRRTRKEQARLYRDYLRHPSGYPAAAPGRSTHARGLAFDMVVTPKSALAALGAVWESLGLTWGGRFKDPIHFDARPSRRIR